MSYHIEQYECGACEGTGLGSQRHDNTFYDCPKCKGQGYTIEVVYNDKEESFLDRVERLKGE